MKKMLILMAGSLFLMLSCTKEPLDKENTLSLKSIKNPVERPIHSEFMFTPDFSLGMRDCVPAGKITNGGHISGWSDHTGKVNTEKSYSNSVQCWLIFENPDYPMMPTHLGTIGQGAICSANGDCFYFTANEKTSLSDGAMTGTVSISDGTGRFKGATGQATINGKVDFASGIVTWTGDGTIVY